jgi:hypothetical protein
MIQISSNKIKHIKEIESSSFQLKQIDFNLKDYHPKPTLASCRLPQAGGLFQLILGINV